MDTKTHQRGPADTSKGRFAKVLAVSLLLHLPFTPWAALVGLLSLWSPPIDDSPAPDITGIPVDLIEDQPLAAPQPAEPTSAPSDNGSAESAPAPAAPKKKPLPAKITDAGAPDAEADAEAPDAGVEAGVADAGSVKSDAGSEVKDGDAGANPDAGTPDAGAKPLSDPTLVAGVKQVADPNANVKLTIYTDKIRTNPLGARIGPLLRSLYQWRDFFGPTAIDPIRDIDQIYVVGSQLRDSSNVVAILRHHVPMAKMRAAVDALVRADQAGEWLDAGVPVASAHADGAERRFLLPNSQTVIVTPPSAYASALKAGKMIHLLPSSGPEAALIYLATPWRAFLGLPVKVPQTIKWARVRITPTADGGASAELEAEDEDEATAAEDAAYLTRTATAVSQLNLGFIGSIFGQQSHKFVEHVAFSANGKMLRGEAQVTADQLSAALDFAEAYLADRATRRVKAAPSAGGGR
ncbi:MAG: hypothetical protein ABJB12_04960 [Pseudomonadota bacterium]